MSSSLDSMDCSADDCVELDVCIVERDMRRTTAAPENVREEVLSTTFERTLEIYNGKTVWYSSANLGTKVCWQGSVWDIMSGGKACGQNSRMGFIGRNLAGANLYLGLPSGNPAGDTNTYMGRIRCGSGNFCAQYDGDTPVMCPHPPSDWPCPKGSFWSASADICQHCGVGTFSASSGSFECMLCQPGTFAPNNNSASCTPCPLGFTSLPGNDKLSGCNLCDTGFTPSSISNCTMCEAGKYKIVSGDANCTPCPTGSTSGPGSKNVNECICDRGYTIGNETEHCVACIPGEFKNVTGTGECMSCPSVTLTSFPGAGSMTDCKCKPGFTGSDGDFDCRPCAEGEYKGVMGSAACITCDAGKYSFPSAASCFSIEIETAGEWEIVATSAGSGSSQSIELKVGISRSNGMEQKEAWATGVVHSVRSATTTTTNTHASQTLVNKVGGSAGFCLFVCFGFSAGRTSTNRVDQTVNTVAVTDSTIANSLSHEHAETISAFLEENTESTITQSFGNTAASGAGVIWQFEYKIRHLFGTNTIGTRNIVLTNNVDERPCCLPGTFLDHSKPHGPCLPGYPCACSDAVCFPTLTSNSSEQGWTESDAAFTPDTNTVHIGQILNENHIHLDINDLLLQDVATKFQVLKEAQSNANIKLDKVSKELSKTLSSFNQSCATGTMQTTDDAGCYPSTPVWDPSMSPTWLPDTSSVPPWNQLQYKSCQPLFDSWADMRRRLDEGSLVIKTGGLSKLMVPEEYESWVCVHDDACALGGDDFFCYVFNEATSLFVPWDQNSKLKLFSSKARGTSASALATLVELQSENRLLQELLRQLMKK